MSLIYTRISLSNPKLDIGPLEVDALADTGSVYLVIPEHIKIQLKLEVVRKNEVTLANGRRIAVPYVGPVEVRFRNRIGFGGAIVMGDQVLLGTIAMDDMDLVIIPKTRKIEVNPENPNIAHGFAY